MSRSRRARTPDERMLRRTAWVVGLQMGAGVAVTVLVLALVATLVVLHSQRQDENRLLQTAVRSADDVVDPPAGAWIVVLHDGRMTATPGLPPGLPDVRQLTLTASDHQPRTIDVVMHGREYRLQSQPRRGGAVQVVLDLHSDQVERARLLQTLLVVGGIGLLVSVAAGVWLGRRSVRPLATALALQHRFVADAGHELRTPVALVSTRAQLIRRHLRQHADADRLEADIGELVRHAHQLAEILDDLLLTADPREEAVAERVDLRCLVVEIVTATRPEAERQGKALQFASSASDACVNGVGASLRRALIAMLDNGIRHAASTVRVELTRKGRHVLVDVTDDGEGIAENVLPRIFERFVTVSGGDGGDRRRRYGLGLSLVSEIAARHGGAVTAANLAAGGARFRLMLPAAKPARGTRWIAPKSRGVGGPARGKARSWR